MRPDKTRAKARADMNDLISELRKMGFVCIKTMGYYQGGSEQSLFVADANNKGNLKEVLMHFGKKYEQDTILYKELGHGSKLIVTRGKKFGNETKDAHSTSFGKSTTANYSKVGGRTFSDTIDIADDFWPEDEETLMNTFKYEIDESKQADAAMNCLKNRNKHCIAQEEEEMSLIDMFDERFKYRSDLRKMANDTTKEAYMIIRKEFGDSMWRQLHMDDCDERGLIDELNWVQETYGITNAQDLADVQLGRKSVKNFKKSEEQEEEKSKLSESELEDLAFRLADYLVESFIVLEDQDEQYGDLVAAVEKILEEDVPASDSMKDCYAWCRKWHQKIEGLTYSYYNDPNPLSYYEEQEEHVSAMERRDYILAVTELLADKTDDNLDDLYYAVANVMDETGDYPESTNEEDCNDWCDSHCDEVKNRLGIQKSEEEETQVDDVIEQIINNGLSFWEVWEMSKRGQATKKEAEIAGVLPEVFEVLMYTGEGEILNKVDSGEIDKRILKHIIVDILLEQDVDTYPSDETEYNSWVRKHNKEIVESLEKIVGTEEQEEEPWEIHYPTEKELMDIARLNKVAVDDIFEAEICDHYLCALEYGDDTGLDEEDEKLLEEWCSENRYLHQLTQNDGEFPEAYFGKCDICGMAGNVVPVLCVKRA